MNNITAMAVVSGIVGLLVGCLGVLAYRYRRMYLASYDRQKQNLLCDLELATSDQLLEEIRKRPLSYILLMPVNNMEEGSFGLKVEAHCIDPVPMCGILKMAGAIAQKELERQGIELPDGPDFGPPQED
jgi:hypothetical protein